MRRETTEVAQFRCKGESGNIYTVRKMQNFTIHNSMSGKPQKLPGSQYFVLDDESSVTPLSDDSTYQYKIVQTDERLCVVAD